MKYRQLYIFIQKQIPVIISTLFSLAVSLLVGLFFESRSNKLVLLYLEEINQICYNLDPSTPVTLDKKALQSERNFQVPKGLGITVNGIPQTRIITSYWRIKNTGQRPIREEDFDEELTVFTNNNAQIEHISYEGTEEIWSISESKKKAKMKPQLFNPGEEIIVSIVYNYDAKDASSKKLNWTARIAGLKKIIVSSVDDQIKKEMQPWNVIIFFRGMQIVILVIFSCTFFIITTCVLHYKKIVLFHNFLNHIYMMFLMFLCWSTAEIMASFIARDQVITYAWRYILPLLTIHILTFIHLLRRPSHTDLPH